MKREKNSSILFYFILLFSEMCFLIAGVTIYIEINMDLDMIQVNISECTRTTNSTHCNGTDAASPFSHETRPTLHWTQAISVFLLILPCSCLGSFLNIKAILMMLNKRNVRRKYVVIIEILFSCVLTSCVHGPLEVIILILNQIGKPSIQLCRINEYLFVILNLSINTSALVTAWEIYQHINIPPLLRTQKSKLVISSFSWLIIIPILLADISLDAMDPSTVLSNQLCDSIRHTSSAHIGEYHFFVLVFNFILSMALLFGTVLLYIWSICVVKSKLRKIDPRDTNSIELRSIRSRTENENKHCKNTKKDPDCLNRQSVILPRNRPMIPRKNTRESLVRTKYILRDGISIGNSSATSNVQQPTMSDQINDVCSSYTSENVVVAHQPTTINSTAPRHKTKESMHSQLSTVDSSSEITDTSKIKQTKNVTEVTEIEERKIDLNKNQTNQNKHTPLELKISRHSIGSVSEKVKRPSPEVRKKRYSTPTNINILQEYKLEPITSNRIQDALLSVSVLPVTMYAVSPHNRMACGCDDEDDDNPLPPLIGTSGYLSRLNSSNETEMSKPSTIRTWSLSSSKTTKSWDGSRRVVGKQKKKFVNRKRAMTNVTSMTKKRRNNMKELSPFSNGLCPSRSNQFDFSSGSYGNSLYSYDEFHDFNDVFSASGSSKRTSSSALKEEQLRREEEMRKLTSTCTPVSRLKTHRNSTATGQNDNKIISLVSDSSFHNLSIPGMPTSTAFYLACDNLKIQSKALNRKHAMCLRNIDELNCMQNYLCPRVKGNIRKVRSLEDFNKFSRKLSPPKDRIEEPKPDEVVCTKCQNAIKNNASTPSTPKKTRHMFTQTDFCNNTSDTDITSDPSCNKPVVCPAIKVTRPSLPDKTCDCKNKENKNLRRLFHNLIRRSSPIKNRRYDRNLTTPTDERSSTGSAATTIRSGQITPSIIPTRTSLTQRQASLQPQQMILRRSIWIILSMIVNILPCAVLEIYDHFSNHGSSAAIDSVYTVFHGLQSMHIIACPLIYVFTNVRLMQAIRE